MKSKQLVQAMLDAVDLPPTMRWVESTLYHGTTMLEVEDQKWMVYLVEIPRPEDVTALSSLCYGALELDFGPMDGPWNENKVTDLQQRVRALIEQMNGLIADRRGTIH